MMQPDMHYDQKMGYFCYDNYGLPVPIFDKGVVEKMIEEEHKAGIKRNNMNQEFWNKVEERNLLKEHKCMDEQYISLALPGVNNLIYSVRVYADERMKLIRPIFDHVFYVTKVVGATSGDIAFVLAKSEKSAFSSLKQIGTLFHEEIVTELESIKGEVSIAIIRGELSVLELKRATERLGIMMLSPSRERHADLDRTISLLMKNPHSVILPDTTGYTLWTNNKWLFEKEIEKTFRGLREEASYIVDENRSIPETVDFDDEKYLIVAILIIIIPVIREELAIKAVPLLLVGKSSKGMIDLMKMVDGIELDGGTFTDIKKALTKLNSSALFINLSGKSMTKSMILEIIGTIKQTGRQKGEFAGYPLFYTTTYADGLIGKVYDVIELPEKCGISRNIVYEFLPDPDDMPVLCVHLREKTEKCADDYERLLVSAAYIIDFQAKRKGISLQISASTVVHSMITRNAFYSAGEDIAAVFVERLEDWAVMRYQSSTVNSVYLDQMTQYAEEHMDELLFIKGEFLHITKAFFVALCKGEPWLCNGRLVLQTLYDKSILSTAKSGFVKKIAYKDATGRLKWKDFYAMNIKQICLSSKKDETIDRFLFVSKGENNNEKQ